LESLSSRGGATRAGTRKAPRSRRTQTLEGKPAATNGAAAGLDAQAEPSDEAQEPSTPLAANAGTTRRAASDEATGSNDAEAPPKPGGAEIVSLDKFRKK